MEKTVTGFPAGCRTTAMSILPHRDVDRALELVMGLDIPFWPQLPNTGFYEDMYAQASYDFPGVTVNPEDGKISFSHDKFERDIDFYALKLERPAGFNLKGDYGVIYRRFLEQDLHSYAAIHGQITGPINLGFRINDEALKPLVYDDSLRALLFDFIQRKFNAQLKQIRQKNERAFVWLDEPGLIWVFSGLSGYTDVHAKREYLGFLAGLDGLKALHLCTNINLSYLLELGINFLSFDAYQLGAIPREYAVSVARFLRDGGIISWGIVPTEPLTLQKETPTSLARRLLDYWAAVEAHTGITTAQIAAQALIAPARCCVKSFEFSSQSRQSAGKENEPPGARAEEHSVEKAYGYLKEVSGILRDKFGNG